MDRSPSKLEAIVDRQVRLWLEERKLRTQGQQGSNVWPCITISRQFGSQGAKLGQMLAEKMGFSFWDQEFVHAISDRAGMDEQMIATLDEHTRNTMEVFIDGILRGRSYSEGEYLRQLMRFIHTLANHGGAVIVGRGAQFILGVEQALHVRIVSPFSKRVRELAERKNCTQHAARAEIERVGKERVAFIQHHYSREISESTAYDVILNLGTVNMENAVDVVMAAYNGRFGRVPTEEQAEEIRIEYESAGPKAIRPPS